jgi:HK97 family phage portal protein
MSLFGLFERRNTIESPTQPLTSTALLEALGGMESDAGVPVSEINSLHMPAVWRAIAVTSCVAASLPLHIYAAGTKDRKTSPLLADPHPELTPYELWRLNYVHRLLWGNGYLQKVRNRAGVVKELWPLRPDRVRVTRVKPEDELPGMKAGKLFQVTDNWGVLHPLTTREVLHIPGLGYDGITGCSPIRAAAQGVGLALAAEKGAARLFGSGNLVSGVLQTEQRLNADQAAQLKASWKAKMAGVGNAHEIAVLDSGASFEPVTMPFKDAQFLESRQFQISEIARMFGVPLFLLMETQKSTSWGTGLEQQAQGFVTFDLGPTWLTPTEQRVQKELLPVSQYAKYSVQGLLRGDSAARATWYRAMRDVGAFSADDIRAYEDLPPLAAGKGGDVYLQPMYMAPLGSDPLADDSSAPAAARAAAHLAEAQRLLTTPETGTETKEGGQDDADRDD